MTAPSDRWAAHHREWRDPAGVVAGWPGADAGAVDPALLRARATGRWWEIVESLGVTILVTREYEHFALSLGVVHGRPATRLLRLPHPSGIAIDRARGEVHIASTRNPNAILTLRPASRLQDREDVPPFDIGRPLMPSLTRHLPGATYLHDLAMIGGDLHANSVGSNAVIRIGREGETTRAWWPACIDRPGDPDGPAFGLNYLQVNSIAAGETLAASWFTASADRISARRPGHRNFPVDRRGVLFSGETREPAARGLTRPHSARLVDGVVWLDDSGYGTAGPVVAGRYEPAARLPGWTRGLCAAGPWLIVGTSRVIPRFHRYAPGLDVDRSICGLHLLHRESREIHGSLVWPDGNQIFAIETAPAAWTSGFPFAAPRARGAPAERERERERLAFYAWRANDSSDPIDPTAPSTDEDSR